MSTYNTIPKKKSELLALVKKYFQVKTQDEAMHRLVYNFYLFNPRFKEFLNKELKIK